MRLENLLGMKSRGSGGTGTGESGLQPSIMGSKKIGGRTTYRRRAEMGKTAEWTTTTDSQRKGLRWKEKRSTYRAKPHQVPRGSKAVIEEELREQRKVGVSDSSCEKEEQEDLLGRSPRNFREPSSRSKTITKTPNQPPSQPPKPAPGEKKNKGKSM